MANADLVQGFVFLVRMTRSRPYRTWRRTCSPSGCGIHTHGKRCHWNRSSFPRRCHRRPVRHPLPQRDVALPPAPPQEPQDLVWDDASQVALREISPPVRIRSLANQKATLKAEDFSCLRPRIHFPNAGVILAQPFQRVLSAGKLDFPFRLRRHPVAGRRTISPGPYRLQNMAIAGEASALENERAVHAPIGSDDKAHSYFLTACGTRQQRIRRSQRLGRLNFLTRRPRADMAYIDELGGASERPGNLALTLGESRRGQARGRIHCPSKGRQKQQP